MKIPFLKYGSKKNLPTQIESGTIYFTTDTNEMYADYPGPSGEAIRHQIGGGGSTPKAYKVTLTAANWSGTTYNYTNKDLKCGPEGDVPPIITYTSNQSDYNNITSATATAGSGIVFTTSSKPSSNIDVIIIDFV